MKIFSFSVTARFPDNRLDQVLSNLQPDLSRRQAKRLIDRGSVFVNRKRIRKASFRVTPPAFIRIFLKNNDELENKSHQIHWSSLILFRDADLISVNKPAGIPTAPTPYSAVHNVYGFLKREGILPARYFPFHRLDLETSGVLLIPLSRRMAAHLNRQMKDREIKKQYLALCAGICKEKSWEISGRIIPQSGTSRQKFTEQEQPANSLTRFNLIAQRHDPDICLIGGNPVTGRTHQIRLHLLKSGLPVIGDPLYFPARAEFFSEPQPSRLMLHCFTMCFNHPLLKDPLIIQAPLPDDFKIPLFRYLPELRTMDLQTQCQL
ncbi:MAG: RluA family pseudouridine synthase [Calditrichia bacterium]